MNVNELTLLVLAWFRKNAGRFGLDPATVRVLYLLNWGGFVNASFNITDGLISYHLKLADEEWSQSGLEQWYEMRELLSQRYDAPQILAWVEIPRTDFKGLLFEHIPGKTADLAAHPELLERVLGLLKCLHADADLAGQLKDLDEDVPTCSEYFIDLYIDRFDDDLSIVVSELPPFVSLGLVDWMMGEIRELEGRVRDLPAFQQLAASPTHGDLWASNILVTEDGRFKVIDWDDLSLGDPALDYAIVLGPFWLNGMYSQAQLENMLPPGDGLCERFQVCLRAYLLDKIIDSLADWVECSFAPEHQAIVREEKERCHRDALSLYKKLYPDSGEVPD